MTLSDITLPITYEWGCEHALVFAPALAARLAELHAEHGRPDCHATPVPLSDGRLMLTADILIATEPGGYLHEIWANADMEVLLPAVEIIPLADAIALLPPESPSPVI
jgi:hypothetical protein